MQHSPCMPPDDITYPPAPWHAHGQLWMGFFRADTPAALPKGLTPLLDPHMRGVALVRYHAGSTLTYDELVVGALARVGMHVGIYVEHIYVNSIASLWGGRCIWGLPKKMALFTWEHDTCSITDDGGTIAAFALAPARAWLPLMGMLGGIGQRDGRWAVLYAPLVARLGTTRMEVREWSPRFACTLTPTSLFALTAPRFAALFPAPILTRRHVEPRSSSTERRYASVGRRQTKSGSI